MPPASRDPQGPPLRTQTEEAFADIRNQKLGGKPGEPFNSTP